MGYKTIIIILGNLPSPKSKEVKEKIKELRRSFKEFASTLSFAKSWIAKFLPMLHNYANLGN